ncbi:MAG TPA: cellulose synthase family protein [Saprospiraceae bacterium]|nr:cellulose synthase family protein [Saprospiraceae bacterium]
MTSVMIAYTVIFLYTLVLLSITLYCLLQFHLLFQYQKGEKNKSSSAGKFINSQDLPFVTIQLPIYNERYVVERLLDNIVHLDYPANKLEIQVLDDSTDDTSIVCKDKIEKYKSQGYDMKYLHRSERDGFKAGALRDALLEANGEYIAIFDADFLPPKDFLKQTIPYFNDPKVGVVQTRWEHINEDFSLITRLQAFQLNVHFTIEQGGRQNGGYLLQFNGTAGVWRRKTITDAGGWQADTLTEDLDLSYRAQMKGWKIIYRKDVISPAELPSEMSGLKSQQFRWMKGGAENAKKLIPSILRSEMSFIKKLHATAHLLSSSIFLLVFLLAVLSVPALFMMSTIHLNVRIYGIFMLGMMSTGAIYFTANKDTAWKEDSVVRKMIKFTIMFPLFLSLSMGLSLHNSIAVLQGYLGRKSAFVRTPKFNIHQLQDNFKKSIYSASNVSVTTIIEGILALYFLVAIIIGVDQGKTSFILYHLMLMTGFGSIFIYSIKHAYQR